jgi:titin
MVSVYGAGSILSNVVTNTNDSGVGSLRASIFYAIDHPNTTITFNIPTNDPGHANNVYTIKPTDVMTTLGAGTTVDGSTQPNGNSKGPSIVIDGSQWPAPIYTMPGLLLNEANCTVKSITVMNCSADGIQIKGSGVTGNIIAGCYVGTNSTGTAAATNAFAGISITDGAHGNTIGGTTTTFRNVISGNTGIGIYFANATGNFVSGNYIGTDRKGAVALPNGYAGVDLELAATSNTIGGTTAGSRNLISGNPMGVVVIGAGTNLNLIRGNYIGTNAAGTGPLPNNGDGILIFGGAQQNTVGGAVNGSGNVISANNGDGVTIADPGTNGNVVAGNLIGTNGAGTTALANASDGVGIFNGAQSNTVGGTKVRARNVISGNGGDGITLADSGTNLNTILGNFIGLNSAGTSAIANGFRGITMFGGPQANVVGGTVTGAGNVISGNTFEGITLFDTATTHNSFRRNSIYNNGDLGISLSTSGGGTPNDLQAAPSLSSATLVSGNVTINGSLTSTPSRQFQIEFFASPMPDPSGFGEGQSFLGTLSVTTNTSGKVSFSTSLPTTAPVGYVISATATNPAGSTSEFSNAVTIN